MDEKDGNIANGEFTGGELVEEHKPVSANYIDKKIVITVIIGIILGTLAVAVMALFGFRLSKNIGEEGPPTNQPARQNLEESVAEYVEIEYDAVVSRYGVTDNDNLATCRNSLMCSYGVDDAEYTIIRSLADLEDFAESVNRTLKSDETAAPFAYTVNDEFFNSGVIIAISKENAGLSSVSIEKIYRNQDYNLDIYANYEEDEASMQPSGRFALVEIQNIQPKTVKLFWNQNPDARAQREQSGE